MVKCARYGTCTHVRLVYMYARVNLVDGVRVYALRAHVRTHDISSRVPASERANEQANERTSVGVRARVGGGRETGGREAHW